MKTLTLTALGLAAALAGTAASADTLLLTPSGQYLVVDEDNHVSPLHAPRVVVLPHTYTTARVIHVDRHDSPAERLIDIIDDMDHAPRAALWPFVYYAH